MSMDLANPTLVVHGGAGKELEHGCIEAAQRGRGQLGVSTQAAAIAAVAALEDEGSYNAGARSNRDMPWAQVQHD